MTDQPMAAYCGKLEAEIGRLRADNEKYKEWCRKLIEGGDFTQDKTRNAVIEGCAQLVERECYDHDEAVRLAALIRALKSK